MNEITRAIFLMIKFSAYWSLHANKSSTICAEEGAILPYIIFILDYSEVQNILLYSIKNNLSCHFT